MNAIARILTRMTTAALTVGLLAPLCACVDLPSDQTPVAALGRAATPTDTSIEAKTPAAAEISRIAAEPGKWPTFQDIPAVPSDVRTPNQWRQSILSLKGAGAVVVRNSGPETFTLNNSAGFAAGVKAGLDARAAAPPTAAEIAESAAFVKAARARATPPPRPH